MYNILCFLKHVISSYPRELDTTNTLDPWATRAGTEQVHSYAIFFNECAVDPPYLRVLHPQIQPTIN